MSRDFRDQFTVTNLVGEFWKIKNAGGSFLSLLAFLSVTRIILRL